MAAVEVVPGVWGITQGYVSAFVLDGGGLSLVDAGLTAKADAFRRSLAQIRPGNDRVDHVAITHHHVDHTGGLSALTAGAETTIWAHPADTPIIRGDAPAPRPPGRNPLERAGIAGMLRFGPAQKPARVDREISDGEELPIGDGLVAYHTPGHTAGHVSFLMPSKRLLFVGDAAGNMMGRLGPPFGLFTEDHSLIRPSIAKLASLDFDVACFGHGRVLKGKANAAFRKLVEKLAG